MTQHKRAYKHPALHARAHDHVLCAPHVSDKQNARPYWVLAEAQLDAGAQQIEGDHTGPELAHLLALPCPSCISVSGTDKLQACSDPALANLVQGDNPFLSIQCHAYRPSVGNPRA